MFYTIMYHNPVTSERGADNQFICRSISRSYKSVFDPWGFMQKGLFIQMDHTGLTFPRLVHTEDWSTEIPWVFPSF
jgi:hypothetical protein